MVSPELAIDCASQPSSTGGRLFTAFSSSVASFVGCPVRSMFLLHPGDEALVNHASRRLATRIVR